MPTDLLLLVSLDAGYMCFQTGYLGAKAVWQERIQAAHAGFPGGPGELQSSFRPGKGTQ